MNRLVVFIFLFLMLTGQSNIIFAQESQRKKLESKRLALKNEIKKIKTYLDNTKKKERTLTHEVNDLNKKIDTRENLISTINEEVIAMSSDIGKNEKKIRQLETSLDKLKQEYALMILKSYQHRTGNNRLLFLLSSDSFFQAFQRFQYMKQYTRYRKNQGDIIQQKAMKLRVMNDSLSVLKNAKSNLIEEKKYEQSQLATEKDKQQELVDKYKKKKRKYINQLKSKRKEEQKLTQQIENLIKGAIKSSGTTKSEKFALTPEAKALANEFSSNKGKLPWPVQKGLVTVGFGRQPDPMKTGVTIESSGVRIATNEGAEALAVFEGKVMAIQKNPQNGILSVLLQHGNYITVYSGLDKVNVSKGEKVNTKESLGTIHTDKVIGKTILKFQIWKDVTKQNPAHWVYKM